MAMLDKVFFFEMDKLLVDHTQNTLGANNTGQE